MSVLRVTSKIRQSDKSFLFVVSSLTRTTSPTERLGSRFCHFDLFWRFRRYYLFHLIQNWSARYCALLHHLRAYRSCGTKLPGWGARGRVFIVSCIAGVNGCGSWMSEGIAEMGRLLAFPVTPAMRVTSSSWVSYGRPIPSKIPSSTRRTVPICRSNTPPKWRVKYPPATLFCYKLLDSCLVHLRKCLFQLWFHPTMLVPRSHLGFVTDPRMAKTVAVRRWTSWRPQFLVPQYEWHDYSDRWRWDQPRVLRWLHRLWVFSSRFPRGQRHRSLHLWRAGWSPFDLVVNLPCVLLRLLLSTSCNLPRFL